VLLQDVYSQLFVRFFRNVEKVAKTNKKAINSPAIPLGVCMKRALLESIVLTEVKASDLRVRRALNLLQQDSSISAAHLAAKLNLSVPRLRHLFKTDIKISLTQYIRLTRLEKARGLLLSSFFTIKEVAGMVGINDVSHFVRDFKSRYGQTPSESRVLAHRK
jgi:transcriptional regulator GlxA family with amidase domain